MIIVEKIDNQITYNYEDILSWVKTFAARQLGLTNDDILDENVIITPDNLKDITINVTHQTVKTNKKETEEALNN